MAKKSDFKEKLAAVVETGKSDTATTDKGVTVQIIRKNSRITGAFRGILLKPMRGETGERERGEA